MKLAHWTTNIAGAMLTLAVTTASAELINDVTFNGVGANGVYVTGKGGTGPESGSAVQSYANDNNLFGATTSSWSFLVKDKDKNNSVSADYSGFHFTLAADDKDKKSGTWTLTVTDLNPDSGLSIPFEMDFLAYMHGGNNGAFYFFDDREISASNAGTFQITFKNNSGNFPGLSNFDLLVRDLRDISTQPPAEVDIPEPASMLLFGAGLLGLGLSRRRKLA